MKSNEKIMAAIKQRKSLCDPFLTVSKILETGGMGTWTGACCERIAAAELIDGENVRIAFLSMYPDLELMAEGLRACRNILECYVAHDILADACEMLCLEESMRGSINEVARILREMKWRDLFGICVKEDERMRMYAAAEIRQRLALAECREKLKELFCNFYVRVRHRHLIAVCKEARG